MGLDQSSRAVELKPLKEKRKGFRHTLAIRTAGRTDPDEMRVYRWLKAYLKPYPQSRTPHPIGRAGRAVERRDGEPPPHTPHPRRARAPSPPAAECYGTLTRRLKITSYRLQLTARDAVGDAAASRSRRSVGPVEPRAPRSQCRRERGRPPSGVVCDTRSFRRPNLQPYLT